MTSPYRWAVLAVAIGAFMQTHVHYLVSQATSALVCVAGALVVPSLGAGGAAAAALAAGLLIGGMILPIVLGRVVDVTGSFAAAFLVAAAMQGIALAFGAFMVETGARAHPAER
ncbi:MAG: hypothetical protein HYU25_16420 [Candidatus Rokubacteria bacterium]|nr:hypothetical protein [Candidatus Rokubacteria bacterium]